MAVEATKKETPVPVINASIGRGNSGVDGKIYNECLETDSIFWPSHRLLPDFYWMSSAQS